MSDLLRPVEQGVTQIEKPAVLPTENKPVGAAEQSIITRIDTDGDEDTVLRDIAGITSSTSSTGETSETPSQQFPDDKSWGNDTLIVGGEIISPTAVRVDDSRNPGLNASQERGLLSAITSANGRKDLPDAQRQTNIQDIVNRAIADGVPRETIVEHLQSLGINTVPRTDVAQSHAANGQPNGAETKAQFQANEASVNESLVILDNLITAVLDSKSPPSALQKYVDDAIRNGGIPRDQIEAALRARGITTQRTQEVQASSISEAQLQQDGLKERLKRANNSFGDENAAKILAVTRDWVRYGGSLYDHLTGKDPRLEKDVDYKALPDGRPDMESYKAARHQKVDAWLKEPGNQKWLVEGEQFVQDHKGQISYQMDTVQVRQADGTYVDKQRLTTPYLNDNGWLYYESNYFDKQTGQMTQPNRESTKYRVYFSPDGSNVMETFQDVIAQLNTDPELQKLGFQIKTADVAKLGEREVSAIMNQRDRVVLYLGEEGMARALPILQRYAESNPGMFNQEGVLLGQPLVDSQGNKIPGIVTTSEPKGKSPDPASPGEEYKSFSDVQAKIIESSFRSIITAINEPRTFAQLKAKYPGIHQAISALGDKATTVSYIKAILIDPNGEDFLKRNLQTIYPQWAKAYGISTQNIAFTAA